MEFRGDSLQLINLKKEHSDFAYEDDGNIE